MDGRIRRGILTLILLAVSAAPVALAAQSQEVGGRMRVLVPDLRPQEDADDDFGEDLAEDLRDLLDEFATHRPIDDREVRTALRRFDIDEDELNCIKSRQLASQIDGGLVLCGNYSPLPDDRYRVTAWFVVVRNGERFDVDPIEVADDAHEEAAQHVIGSFERLVEQLRASRFCSDYYQSQQWDNALTNCTRAVELNPQAIRPRYIKGRVLMEQERYEEALSTLQEVLELNAIHENALQTAGYVSAQLGNDDQAQAYYQEYLELQPGNASVRMNVAYELAQAGNPEGAMQLIQEGIELDPENMDLWEQLGNFAFAAAAERVGTVRESEEGEALPAEVQELYRSAIDAYSRVFDARGDSMDVSQLRNIVAAHVQLGELDQAVSFADEVLQAQPDAASIWTIYADALQKQGNLERAIAALDTVKTIDPDYPNLAVRQGNWLLQNGQVDQAIPRLQEAVEQGEQPPDVVANLLLAHGHGQGVNQERWQYALNVLEHAYDFEMGERMKAQVDFWYGFSLYQRAREVEAPQTVESAEQALPMFRRAREYFQSSEPYASNNPQINLDQWVSNAEQYIEIQEAIIQRGR